MKKLSQRRLLIILAAASSVMLAGCNDQAFQVKPLTDSITAPGNFTVPPKVDILLAQDDTGSMMEAYPQISQQMPTFLNSLQSSGWDYHFTDIPLTTDQPITQVIASQYDSNWGAQWIPPYPGAIASNLENVLPYVFAMPNAFNPYVTQSTILDGFEPGFETMRLALTGRVNGTGFLRPDALLVIIGLSNGEDTSDVLYCNRGDGYEVPCQDAPAEYQNTAVCGSYGGTASSCGAGSLNGSFSYYQSVFQGLKQSPTQVQFNAWVANGETNCMGAPRTNVGTRYQQMAAATGGQSYDVCTTPISSILTSLSSQLQSIEIPYEKIYLFLSQQPNVSTIAVTKNIGGNQSSSVSIPQDTTHTNGWDYAGYVSNVYTIDAPTQMDLASGYAIELYGSAKLHGNDTANVTYTPAGAQDAASN